MVADDLKETEVLALIEECLRNRQPCPEYHDIQLCECQRQYRDPDGDGCEWQFDDMLDDDYGGRQRCAGGCLSEHYGAD